MTNAEKIWLNRNRLRSVPTVAFGKRPGFPELKEVNFNKFSSKNGYIRSVGNFAFYYLNRLQYLYLSHQRINYLPANAFDFEQPSNQTLYIYLGNNKLNNTSFEKGIFLNAKRPIHLELYWNPELTYLDEEVFAPFLQLSPSNRISLQDNPLICDCNSYWIIRDRHKFMNQMLNVMCKIGPKQTFHIDLISFDKCIKNGRKRNKLIVN
ncbi:Leucine rich repeat containing protein [Euroglyphus maynei]|uniref:Leucine rich repeat containing protein n=1 Tax=Euroglyphus maynei TaxID=6958 RepID=A0A1Y3ANY0_EURMA|nr:Leucine rich repeat containing protein [Euroglyphus maynei]